MKTYYIPILAAMAAINVSAVQGDWLIDPAPYHAVIATNANSLALENGLVRRVIRLAPNAVTVDYQNLASGEQLLRAERGQTVDWSQQAGLRESG